MTDRTTLILAHRLSSVIGADRILVLKDGAVVQSGHHLEMIQQDGPYRDLMGPQVGEREGVTAPLMVDETAEPDAPASGAFVGSLSAEAGQVTWPDTIRTLLRVVRPYRGQLAVTVVTGIGRVVAFIGVSVLGALVLGGGAQWLADGRADRCAADHRAACWAAALAGILDRARDGLCAAGRHADRPVPQTGCAGAGVSPATAVGRSGGAGDTGRRNRRVLLCPYHRPGDRRGAGAGQRADRDGVDRLAAGSGAGAIPDLRRCVPGAWPAAHRSAGIGRSRRAGSDGGVRDRDHPGAGGTGHVRRGGTTARRVHGSGRELPEAEAVAARRFVVPGGCAGGTHRFRRSGGGGRGCHFGDCMA